MTNAIQYSNDFPKLSYEERIVLKNLVSIVQRNKEKRARKYEKQDTEFWKDHAFGKEFDRYGRPL